MDYKTAELKLKDSLLVALLLLQFITYITTFLDIPVARQVIGFIYYTFVPGFIIVQLLKLNELDALETVIFSVGFSVAFLMLTGLFINEFFSFLSISRPLSLVPLTIVLNVFINTSWVLAYLKDKSVKICGNEQIKLPFSALLLLLLPILSVAGAMCVNVHQNNLILLFTIVQISLLFIFCVLLKRESVSRAYSYIVFIIAIAILFHASLISNHILPFGSDAAVECFTFKVTENNAYWNSTLFRDLRYGRLNAMLSITVLPTVYSSLLNISATSIFKLLFPVIFSLVPLSLYIIWRTYVSEKYAFIAAFLFMAQQTFYTEMLGLSRQMIAELFFALLLLVIAHKKMKPTHKTICFVIFTFALVISHYALALIFAVFIIFVWIIMLILKHTSKNITITMIIFFCTVMFAWYIYTSHSTAFNTLLDVGDYVFKELENFFDLSSRGQMVLRGIGLESPPTIWNAISRAFAYATEFLITVGFIGIVTKRVKTNISREFFSLNLIASMFLAMIILVPGLSNTLNMTRFYHVLLFFLSPLFAIGARFIVNLLFKKKDKMLTSALLLAVVVPYFFFQTGFVYELVGTDSWSVPLSGYRMSPVRLYSALRYIDDYSAFGAIWFSKNVNIKYVRAYADGNTIFSSLSIYALVYYNDFSELTNTTIIADKGVVFLSTVNVIYGKVVHQRFLWNTTELSMLDDLNNIYMNGGCVVYKNSP